LWEQEEDLFDFLLKYGREVSLLRFSAYSLEVFLYPYELGGRTELVLEPALLALLGGMGITLWVLPPG
jgi:hypothetical protein